MHLVILPGDGIGPEICAATRSVLDLLNGRFGLGLTFESHDIGLGALAEDGTTFPKAAKDAAMAADGIILGPISHNDYPAKAEGGVNVSGDLRLSLDLYANIRPARSRDGLKFWGRTPMDLVIVRENTEGFYADRSMHMGPGEFMPTPDMALAIRKITAQACKRIALSAFELAMGRSRHVTAVHKANVLRVSDGLFLREVRAVAARFPEVAYDEQLVDSMTAMLVRDAARFDVVVTTNMYGDILSDEAAELSGSLGLAGSINAGESHCMAQAQHGSAPDIAGQDKANPVSLILSVGLLLDWLGRKHGKGAFVRAAALIEPAVDCLIAEPATRTADLGGAMGTKAFTAALCAEIATRL